jgi:TolB-like protein/DNA-binding winged helix-turn-helix (wHTH) protein
MSSRAQYQFADFTLDTGQRRLMRRGVPIELGKLTYSVLVALVDAAPNVLTHDDLVQRAWGGRLTSPETVTQRIKLLRDSLGDDADQPRYVGLVRGQGYRLLPEVTRTSSTAQLAVETGLSSATATPANAVPRARPSGRSPPARKVPILAGLLLVAAVLVLSDYFGGRNPTSAEPGRAVSASAGVAAPDESPSVAVLPFTSDTPDAEHQYFADGLSGALVNALGRIHGLAVAGRSSSFFFKGRNDNLKTIGDALNVEHVLSGSVQRSGDRLRITAELVDVDTGRRLWGTTYDRTLEDIFAIQDDITERVAAALQLTLRVGELGSAPGAPRNVAAYEEILKGDGYIRELRVDSFQPAIDHYLRATQLDDSSSVAWMALANAYLLGSGNLPERSIDWGRQASEAADRARALTPRAIHVLLWDAQRSIDRGAWNEAAAIYDTQLREERFPWPAIEYGPSAGLAEVRGYFLLQVGRVAEAIPYLERARSTDPLMAFNARVLGDAYTDAGALSAALAEFDRGMQTGSHTAVLQGYAVVAALASGDRREMDRRLAALWPSAATDAHVRMARFLDDPAGGVSELRNFIAREPAAADGLTALVLAHWAGYYGDASTALALLRQIPRQLFSGDDVALALWRPMFSEMRRLPEFNEFVDEIGLVDYWRVYGWPDFCEPVGESFACH